MAARLPLSSMASSFLSGAGVSTMASTRPRRASVASTRLSGSWSALASSVLASMNPEPHTPGSVVDDLVDAQNPTGLAPAQARTLPGACRLRDSRWCLPEDARRGLFRRYFTKRGQSSWQRAANRAPPRSGWPRASGWQGISGPNINGIRPDEIAGPDSVVLRLQPGKRAEHFRPHAADAHSCKYRRLHAPATTFDNSRQD